MSLHRKLNERERMAYASVSRLERERDDLHAQLAERDALLGAIAGWTTETRDAVLEAFQDELNESASYAWYDAAIADLMKLVEALSASAEPSAPVEIDERARLEAYCAKVGLPLDLLPTGEYLIPATRLVSQGWHAHAASGRKA